MSVNLSITLGDGEGEDYKLMGGADGGPEAMALALARRLNFKILAGVYPVWFAKDQLEQVIFEVGLLRDFFVQRMIAREFSEEDLTRNRSDMEEIISRLEQLKALNDWEAYFG